MYVKKIRRLLQLAGLLQTGRAYNVEGLAQECGVSRRTLFRDLNILRQSGVPVRLDEGTRRYHIPGGYYLPPTNFTPEEALALIVLAAEVADESQLPLLRPAQQAALKLASDLPREIREELRITYDAMKIRLVPTNPLTDKKPVFDHLLESITRRRSARIEYDSLMEQEVISTKLSPYRILFSRRSWYVIGRSSLHRSARTFNIGRIQEIEPLEDQYDIPQGFSLKRFFRNAWHLIPESGPDQEIVVRFTPMVSRNVAEVQWHKTQKLRFLDDGSLEYQVTVSGLNEIVWWILSYGDQAEVIKPQKLRRMLADRAEAMAQQYRNTPS